MSSGIPPPPWDLRAQLEIVSRFGQKKSPPKGAARSARGAKLVVRKLAKIREDIGEGLLARQQRGALAVGKAEGVPKRGAHLVIQGKIPDAPGCSQHTNICGMVVPEAPAFEFAGKAFTSSDVLGTIGIIVGQSIGPFQLSFCHPRSRAAVEAARARSAA